MRTQAGVAGLRTLRMKIIGLICILLVVALFSVQNAGVVSVRFLAYAFDGSLAVIVLASFALGILCGILYLVPAMVKKQIAIAGLKKDLARKERPEPPAGPPPRQ